MLLLESEFLILICFLMKPWLLSSCLNLESEWSRDVIDPFSLIEQPIILISDKITLSDAAHMQASLLTPILVISCGKESPHSGITRFWIEPELRRYLLSIFRHGLLRFPCVLISSLDILWIHKKTISVATPLVDLSPSIILIRADPFFHWLCWVLSPNFFLLQNFFFFFFFS